VLAAFAEAATGPVLDAGRGSGRLTGHLAGLGLPAGAEAATEAERQPQGYLMVRKATDG
jgi:hypothetical protein